MSDDELLSQSDIDALVESVASRSRATGEKVISARTPKASREIEPERATMPRSPSPSPPSPRDIEALNDKIAKLADRLDKLEKALNGNFGMSQLAQNFRCTSCNSQGFIAFFVKCTRCGQVKLWGSWPQK
jgi:hypothetical protein